MPNRKKNKITKELKNHPKSEVKFNNNNILNNKLPNHTHIHTHIHNDRINKNNHKINNTINHNVNRSLSPTFSNLQNVNTPLDSKFNVNKLENLRYTDNQAFVNDGSLLHGQKTNKTFYLIRNKRRDQVLNNSMEVYVEDLEVDGEVCKRLLKNYEINISMTNSKFINSINNVNNNNDRSSSMPSKDDSKNNINNNIKKQTSINNKKSKYENVESKYMKISLKKSQIKNESNGKLIEINEEINDIFEARARKTSDNAFNNFKPRTSSVSNSYRINTKNNPTFKKYINDKNSKSKTQKSSTSVNTRLDTNGNS